MGGQSYKDAVLRHKNPLLTVIKEACEEKKDISVIYKNHIDVKNNQKGL